MEEVWKDILGFDGKYQISNLGKVKFGENILKGHKNNSGYLTVRLNRKTFMIHRLVAQNFLENKNSLPCVNHKDYNRTNNNVDNLEWCTYQYNNLYSAYKKNKKIAQCDLNMKVIKTFDSLKECANVLGLDNSTISKVIKGKRSHTGGFKFKYI